MVAWCSPNTCVCARSPPVCWKTQRSCAASSTLGWRRCACGHDAQTRSSGSQHHLDYYSTVNAADCTAYGHRIKLATRGQRTLWRGWMCATPTALSEGTRATATAKGATRGWPTWLSSVGGTRQRLSLRAATPPLPAAAMHSTTESFRSGIAPRVPGNSFFFAVLCFCFPIANAAV